MKIHETVKISGLAPLSEKKRQWTLRSPTNAGSSRWFSLSIIFGSAVSASSSSSAAAKAEGTGGDESGCSAVSVIFSRAAVARALAGRHRLLALRFFLQLQTRQQTSHTLLLRPPLAFPQKGIIAKPNMAISRKADARRHARRRRRPPS